MGTCSSTTNDAVATPELPPDAHITSPCQISQLSRRLSSRVVKKPISRRSTKPPSVSSSPAASPRQHSATMRKSSNPTMSRRRSSTPNVSPSPGGSRRPSLSSEPGSEAGWLAHERVQAHKASATSRLDAKTQRDVLQLFHRLKQKQMSDVVLGNKFVGVADYDLLRTMDFKGLKDMLPGTDEATLRFIFRFFDENLDGRINTAEFLMAVAMLCQPCDTAQEQLDACFRMFDSDASGCLSRQEFGEMIHASVALDLGQLLLTPEGEESMEVQLEKEFAPEVLAFWREAVAFRQQPGELSGVTARAIFERYVREGAPEEINVPAKQRREIEKAFAAATADGQPPPADIFLLAEEEMFRLMEKNAFARLRGDSAMLEGLADAFFSRADLDGDGTVRFDEYRQWASEQPQVLAFFGQLRHNIQKLVASATDVPSAK